MLLKYKKKTIFSRKATKSQKHYFGSGMWNRLVFLYENNESSVVYSSGECCERVSRLELCNLSFPTNERQESWKYSTFLSPIRGERNLLNKWKSRICFATIAKTTLSRKNFHARLIRNCKPLRKKNTFYKLGINLWHRSATPCEQSKTKSCLKPSLPKMVFTSGNFSTKSSYKYCGVHASPSP